MTDAQIIVTSVLGVLTVVGGIYTALQARKANQQSTVVTGYDTLVRNLQHENQSQSEEIKEQGDRIALLERRVEMFLRWGRAVIRWYDSISLPVGSDPMPSPHHSMLEVNGGAKE